MKRTSKAVELPLRGEGIIAATAAGLLTSVWLQPVEAATEGLTAWRAMLWLAIAFVWSMMHPNSQPNSGVSISNSARRWPLCDVAVGLLVVGHMAGGLIVFWSGGQKRFAANLLVEWLGLAAAWWILRNLTSRRIWRRAIARPLLSTAVAVAVLGLWQHYVELPALTKELGPKFQQVRSGAASAAVRQELASNGVPLTEPGLTLFEKRVLDSREPFGMFALANTLGGLLAAALVWLGAAAVVPGPAVSQNEDFSKSSRNPRWFQIGLPLMVLLGWCLLLSKSRTAMAGVAASVVLMMVLRWRTRWPTPSWHQFGKWAVVSLGCLATVISLGIVLLATGAWDLEVLAEAPKSLRYRLQYWIASARLIGENPLIGTGLGQFRDEYLRVRLPAASEEIADPHNLWFDAWVNGGFLAVLGLLAGLVAILRRWVTLSRKGSSDLASASTEAPSVQLTPVAGRDMFVGSISAYIVLFGLSVWNVEWDDRLLALLVLFIVTDQLLKRVPGLSEQLSHWGPALVAVTAWAVHLHGAGGFEMPGALSLWFLPLALFLTDDGPTREASQSTDKRRQWMTGGVWSLLSLAALVLWWPGWRCRQHLESAQTAALRNQGALVDRFLTAAAEADDWNPEPWRQMAEQALRPPQSNSGPGGGSLSENRWKLAAGYLQEAILRNPGNAALLEQLGDVYRQEWEATGLETAADAATAAYLQAHRRFPTDVRIMSRLAIAASHSDRSDLANQAADNALEQDNLNRRLGHVELWLTDAEREELTRLQ